MQVAIIAGGLATRLGELSHSRPKSLIDINGEPFLHYQLEYLKKNGVSDVVLCIGHLGKLIQDHFRSGEAYGIKLKYSIESKPLGTAGALKHAAPLLNDIFVVMYGDSYFTLDFQAIYQYFLLKNHSALMTVFRNYNKYDRSNTDISSGYVVKYDKIEVSKDMIYIDYGLNIFRKTVLESIPENSFYDLSSIFKELINKRDLLAYEVADRFYEIGSPEGLQEFQKLTGGTK